MIESSPTRPTTGTVVDLGNHRVDLYRCPLFHQHFFQNTGSGRWDLRIHFVRRNLKERLIALHALEKLTERVEIPIDDTLTVRVDALEGRGVGWAGFPALG